MSCRPRSKLYRPSFLKCGKASNNYPWNFDQHELLEGIKVELEHTNDVYIAMLIAMDHLYEIPNYYTLLERMEKKATRKK